MSEEEKQKLCSNGYKMNGYCASVAGFKNEYATVSPCIGGFYNATWEDVQTVTNSPDRDFKNVSCWKVSNAWLGFGCNEEWQSCTIK